MAKAKDTAPSAPADPAASVRFRAPYGYYDDDGTPHFWQAGHVVDDQKTIADLQERQAPIE